jgi:DNA topoisomerase-2
MSNKKFRLDSNESDSDEEVIKEVSARSKKTIEDEYIKMNPREHVLLRPDMYVGAITRVPQEMWIWDEDQKRMQFKKIQFGISLFYFRSSCSNF